MKQILNYYLIVLFGISTLTGQDSLAVETLLANSLAWDLNEKEEAARAIKSMIDMYHPKTIVVGHTHSKTAHITPRDQLIKGLQSLPYTHITLSAPSEDSVRAHYDYLAIQGLIDSLKRQYIGYIDTPGDGLQSEVSIVYTDYRQSKEGYSLGNITLGNFINEVHAGQGPPALNIGIRPFRKEESFLTAYSKDKVLVLNAYELRKSYLARILKDVPGGLLTDFFSYDYLILTNEEISDTPETDEKEVPADIDLAALVKPHQYTLRMEGGQIKGTGMDWLLSNAKDAQFLCLAESHNVKEIPEITTQLFKQLQPSGYEYLGLEMGPIVAQQLSQSPLKGNHSNIKKQVIRYPYSIAFSNDAELKMMADVGQLCGDNEHAIWGLDNSFGATHLEVQLRGLAQDDAQRQAVDALLHKIKQYDSGHDFLAEDDQSDIIEKLKTAFAGKSDDMAEDIISTLESSNRIYHNWVLGYGRGTDKNRRYLNLSEREGLMKQLLSKRYNDAKERGNVLPKAILRLGSAHLAPGISSRNLVPSLGNFVKEFAFKNGQEALAVGILCNDKNNCNLEEDEDLGPFAQLVEDRAWTLFDFRPLRPLVHNNQLGQLTKKMRQYIMSYDAIIFVTDNQWASSYTLYQAIAWQYARKYWLYAALVVVLLILLVRGVRARRRKRKGKSQQ